MDNQKKLIHNLTKVIQYFKKNDIPYCVAWGTLLGLIRENNPIPYDDDIDFWIPEEFYYIFRRELFMNHPNFGIHIAKPNEFMQVINNENDGIVDFYFIKKDSHYWWDSWNITSALSKMKLPIDILEPLKHIEWNSIQVNIPNQPEACLTYIYGPNWKTPMKKGEEYEIEIKENVPNFTPKK